MQKVVTTIIDDLDGSAGSETVSFALDSREYEIDLNAKNADKLRKALAPYVAAARRKSRGGSAAPRSARGRSASGVDLAAVRAWAASNDIKLNSRGRIAAEVIAQYHAAGN